MVSVVNHRNSLFSPSIQLDNNLESLELLESSKHIPAPLVVRECCCDPTCSSESFLQPRDALDYWIWTRRSRGRWGPAGAACQCLWEAGAPDARLAASGCQSWQWAVVSLATSCRSGLFWDHPPRLRKLPTIVRNQTTVSVPWKMLKCRTTCESFASNTVEIVRSRFTSWNIFPPTSGYPARLSSWTGQSTWRIPERQEHNTAEFLQPVKWHVGRQHFEFGACVNLHFSLTTPEHAWPTYWMIQVHVEFSTFERTINLLLRKCVLTFFGPLCHVVPTNTSATKGIQAHRTKLWQIKTHQVALLFLSTICIFSVWLCSRSSCWPNLSWILRCVLSRSLLLVEQHSFVVHVSPRMPSLKQEHMSLHATISPVSFANRTAMNWVRAEQFRTLYHVLSYSVAFEKSLSTFGMDVSVIPSSSSSQSPSFR